MLLHFAGPRNVVLNMFDAVPFDKLLINGSNVVDKSILFLF